MLLIVGCSPWIRPPPVIGPALDRFRPEDDEVWTDREELLNRGFLAEMTESEVEACKGLEPLFTKKRSPEKNVEVGKACRLFRRCVHDELRKPTGMGELLLP